MTRRGAFLVALGAYAAVVVIWLLSGLAPVAARVAPGAFATFAGRGVPGSGLAQTSLEVAHGMSAGAAALDYLFSALNLALAGLLVLRRRDDVTARLMLVGMLGTAATFNLQSHAVLDAAGSPLHNAHLVLHHVLPGVAYAFAVVVFPDGHLIPRWRPGPLRALYAAGLVTVAYLAYRAIAAGTLGFVLLFGLLIPIVGVSAQRYRSTRSGPVGNRQARLLLWGLVPSFVAGVTFASIAVVGPGSLDPMKGLVFRVLSTAFAVVPVALFVGILRYRLWDIEVVVTKTLQYGALAVFIAGAYVASVVGASAFVGAGLPSPVLSLVAAAIVAFAFQPLRHRMERLANRVVYGERATPYEVMGDLARWMSAVVEFEDVLPRVAEAAGRAVHAARATVRLDLPASAPVSVAWPLDALAVERGLARRATVVHDGEVLGELTAIRPAAEPFTSRDERVLAGVARQAGLAMRTVRLTLDLQARLDELARQADELEASRMRILTARSEEVSRLERELDSVVGAKLAALDSALAEADVAAHAEDALTDAEHRAVEALEALRDLARDTYPHVLTDHGVVAALESHARRAGSDVVLEADDASIAARLPAHVEAAVYFCCVAKLGTGDGRVRITRSQGWIEFVVENAAAGDRDLAPAVDRVAAIGGDVHADGAGVRGRVPVPG